MKWTFDQKEQETNDRRSINYKIGTEQHQQEQFKALGVVTNFVPRRQVGIGKRGHFLCDIQKMDIEVDIHEQKWKVGPSHSIHVVTTKPLSFATKVPKQLIYNYTTTRAWKYK
jgi:hypothetical protein